MGEVKLQKLLLKRGWRSYNGEKVLKIREQFPDIDPYLHTEIVLDWISAKKPRQEVVSDFWDCSVQLHLNSYYQDLIRQHLLARKYQVSYICRTREISLLRTCQPFTLDHLQISDLLAQQPVTLCNTCYFTHCCHGNTDHMVHVRLDRDAHCLLDVNETSHVTDKGHTHVGYKHWFIIKPGTGELVSLLVNTIESVVSQVKKCKQFQLYCLMLNCDSVLGE